MKNLLNFQKTGLKTLACAAIVPFLMLNFSFAQTFSGGTGISTDPYILSTPADLAELATLANSDTSDNQTNTSGKYFKMINHIDMVNITDFVPIGRDYYYDAGKYIYPAFSGNFDGNGFSIKNLTLPSSGKNIALFGYLLNAVVSNITLDDVSCIYTGAYSPSAGIAAFVSYSNNSTIDNCTVVNCILKSIEQSMTITGFISSMSSTTINNCHIVNASLESMGSINGFCGQISTGCLISNSSITSSLLTGVGNNSSPNGFASRLQGGKLSGCFVSNCTLTARGNIYGFMNYAMYGEITNCYVQATLSRTQATGYSSQVGFIGTAGYTGGEGGTTETLPISNCYSACEYINIDGNYDNDAIFVKTRAPNTIDSYTNCYYLSHPQIAAFPSALPISSGLTEKTEAELQSANMVAHPGTANNSLNYQQSSAVWKADFNFPTNKGFPILTWQTQESGAMTLAATAIDTSKATLNGSIFDNGETVVEKGFQWRKIGETAWTTVSATGTTDIAAQLTTLKSNTVYEFRAYLKTNATDIIKYGIILNFTTKQGGVNIIDISQLTDAVSLFPNPTTGQLTIESGQLTIETIEIVDITGKTVNTYSPQNNTINISELPNGIYFMQIYSKKQKIVRKFVKQ